MGDVLNGLGAAAGASAPGKPAHPDAVLERLTRLHPKVIDLSLGRIERLLARLGDPHLKLAPVVHIAGTNGKGSTLAFLRAGLEAAGKRVHVYTSPHLVRFNERIRVNGAIIADEALSALLEECEAANGDEPITFFEITTAAAFLAFARVPADMVLLETGLGGRLDATNLIPKPAACAISPVSLDHQHYLGDTLALIAAEKAGILKAGVACAVAAQEPDALAAIEKRATEINAPLFLEGRDWTIARDKDGLEYRDKSRTLALPVPNLPGRHQAGNAGLACAVFSILDKQGLGVSNEAIAQGLIRAEWPARLQRLTHGPLAAPLANGWELWLDGGHNPAAGAVLAAQAVAWAKETPARPLHLVVGMINTKDVAGFLKPLAPLARSLAAVTIPHEANAVPAAMIADAARAVGIEAHVAPDPAAAIKAIAGRTSSYALGAGEPAARVLICGSLYLAGTVLAENG